MLTDDELIDERKRAEKLADLCQLHDRLDGAKAMRAVAAAIAEEQTQRSRRHPGG